MRFVGGRYTAVRLFCRFCLDFMEIHGVRRSADASGNSKRVPPFFWRLEHWKPACIRSQLLVSERQYNGVVPSCERACTTPCKATPTLNIASPTVPTVPVLSNSLPQQRRIASCGRFCTVRFSVSPLFASVHTVVRTINSIIPEIKSQKDYSSTYFSGMPGILRNI